MLQKVLPTFHTRRMSGACKHCWGVRDQPLRHCAVLAVIVLLTSCCLQKLSMLILHLERPFQIIFQIGVYVEITSLSLSVVEKNKKQSQVKTDITPVGRKCSMVAKSKGSATTKQGHPAKSWTQAHVLWGTQGHLTRCVALANQIQSTFMVGYFVTCNGVFPQKAKHIFDMSK